MSDESEDAVPARRVSRALLVAVLSLLTLVAINVAFLIGRFLVYRLLNIDVFVVNGVPFRVVNYVSWGLSLLVLFTVGYAAQRMLRSVANPLEVVWGVVGFCTLFGLLEACVAVVGTHQAISSLVVVPLVPLGLGAGLRYWRQREAMAA